MKLIRNKIMQMTGTYFNGKIILENIVPTIKPVRVIVTFENESESENRGLLLSDFSFLDTQELLSEYHGSFSDEVIEERRNAL
jgi:hypothetical protein